MELSKGMVLRSNYDGLTLRVMHIVDGWITLEVLSSDSISHMVGETFERRLDTHEIDLSHFTVIGDDNKSIA